MFFFPLSGRVLLSLQELVALFIGFLTGGFPRGGGNWGTLKIPREDWGDGLLGNLREH